MLKNSLDKVRAGRRRDGSAQCGMRRRRGASDETKTGRAPQALDHFLSQKSQLFRDARVAGASLGVIVPRMLRQQRFQPALMARRHHPVVPSGTVPDGGAQEHEDKTGVAQKLYQKTGATA